VRKASKKFNSTHGGGRRTPYKNPVDGKIEHFDACKAAHETVNSKQVQFAMAHGLRSVLARFAMFWVPRNTSSNSAGARRAPSMRFAEDNKSISRRVQLSYPTRIDPAQSI